MKPIFQQENPWLEEKIHWRLPSDLSMGFHTQSWYSEAMCDDIQAPTVMCSSVELFSLNDLSVSSLIFNVYKLYSFIKFGSSILILSHIPLPYSCSPPDSEQSLMTIRGTIL